MTEIKAIETNYNGYRFRSRLEARWAVFFDTLHIEYRYEPEGYVLSDGTCYLPDFWLPNVYFRKRVDKPGVWFEIKGDAIEAAYHKVKLLCIEIKKPVFMASGDYFGGHGDIEQFIYAPSSYTDENGVACHESIWCDIGMIFMRCPSCFRVRLEFCESSYASCPHCKNKSELIFDDHAAVLAARSARFEFGEHGR